MQLRVVTMTSMLACLSNAVLIESGAKRVVKNM